MVLEKAFYFKTKKGSETYAKNASLALMYYCLDLIAKPIEITSGKFLEITAVNMPFPYDPKFFVVALGIIERFHGSSPDVFLEKDSSAISCDEYESLALLTLRWLLGKDIVELSTPE